MQDYVGYRTRKRQSQKKKKKTLWKVLVGVAVLIVIFVILGAAVRIYPFDRAWDKTADGFEWLGRHIKSVWPWKSAATVKPEQFLPEGKKTGNYLVAITKQINGQTWLSNLVLLSYDSKTGSASIIYFPNDLLVSIPGAGMDSLSNLVELSEGHITLALVTVENLLGVEIDRYILGSDRDLSIAGAKMGDKYTIDVPAKVSFEDPSLEVKVDLQPGKQDLEGKQLIAYLTYSQPGDELDLIKRDQEFVPLFLKRSASGSFYGSIPDFTKKYANLFDTDASNAELSGLWQTMAKLKGSKLAQVTIPVSEFRLEKTVVHRVNQDKLGEFVNKYVKSESSDNTSSRLKVEILNGCGVPGIGEKVASQLNLDKYQIVNSGNADNFDYPETLIIVYSEDSKVVAAAEDIKNALEVGKLQSHPANQNISDVTIIAGKDFANK